MAQLLLQARPVLKKVTGFSMAEVVITVAALIMLEMSVCPLFLGIVRQQPHRKFSGLGCLFTQQLGFMQTATRYGGCQPLSLFLSDRGTTYEIATGSRFRSRTRMRALAGWENKLTGPGTLSFRTAGAGQRVTTYVLASRSLPRLSRRIAIQPVTGRIVTAYE